MPGGVGHRHRHRHRLRLRRGMPPGAQVGDQRVSEAEREGAARRLARAQHDGRFGSGDGYEQRMEQLLGARSRADVDRLVGDLDDLVPGTVRRRMLRVVAAAHADGRLDFEEFSRRTDRCLEPLDRRAAEGLVGDLGYRLARPVRRRPWWAPVARRVGVPAAVGGVVGTALVAVPAGLDLPGGLSQWLPLAVGTGVFSAVGTGIASLAWWARPPSRRLLGNPGGGTSTAAGSGCYAAPSQGWGSSAPRGGTSPTPQGNGRLGGGET